jgi:hypothetical protein
MLKSQRAFFLRLELISTSEKHFGKADKESCRKECSGAGTSFQADVRDGVKLPSNLQGLYEVRYTGATLDANATIKLLEAIRDIKNYAFPSQSQGEEG